MAVDDPDNIEPNELDNEKRPEEAESENQSIEDDVSDDRGGEPINDERFKQLIAAEFERLAKKAREALKAVRGSLRDGDDAAQSTMHTALRRRKLAGKGRDKPVHNRDEVVALLERHLRRKLNTYRARTLRPGEAGPRLGDAPTPQIADLWKQLFVDQNSAPVYRNPDAIQSYLDDAMSSLREMVEDPERLMIAELLCQDYTQAEISEITGMTVDQVAYRIGQLRELLRRRLDPPSDTDE